MSVREPADPVRCFTAGEPADPVRCFTETYINSASHWYRLGSQMWLWYLSSV